MIKGKNTMANENIKMKSAIRQLIKKVRDSIRKIIVIQEV